jgi:hypothetical protein
MRVVLPKTLAEPLTIPWDKPVDWFAVRDRIDAALEQYVDAGVTGHDPHTPPERFARALRLVVLGNGGCDVWSEIGITTRDGKHIGNTYWTWYKTHPGGIEYTILFIADFEKPKIY